MKKYFNSKEEITQFLIDKATEKYNLDLIHRSFVRYTETWELTNALRISY